MPSKLQSRWDDPFVITNVFPYGAIELNDERTRNIFLVNGQRLKHYHEGVPRTVEEQDVELTEVTYP